MKISAIKKSSITPFSGNMKRVTPAKSDQSQGQLPVDIYENNVQILIVTPIAGIDLDQAEISITQDTLTIQGKRNLDLEGFNFSEEDVYLKECYWGDFSRSVVLPTSVEIEKIEATQRNHVLYIQIPKRDTIQMRIVKIKPKK